jgi:phospholipid/cholesterol/gamma-HCH transport system permease protein
MTAIMVAGRSGSAFAAQIGTMKLTEEVDAMRTIGIAPMEALILPRGGGGGDDAPAGRLCRDHRHHRRRHHQRHHAAHSLLQLPFAREGCGAADRPVGGADQGAGVRHDRGDDRLLSGDAGFGQFRGGGLRTTQAVVQAIFMVIVLDAFFAVFFSQVGWI